MPHREVSAYDARRVREQFRGQAILARSEYKRISSDKDLSDEGRNRLLAPIAERLKAAHVMATRELESLRTAADDELVYYDPLAVRGRAAAAAPAKAKAAADLAALESGRGLLTLARNMEAAQDTASLHGIGLVIAAREDLSIEERAAVAIVLDSPHAARADRAISTLIGIKTELARHVAEGPLGDAATTITRDPVAVLTAHREATSYVDPRTREHVFLHEDVAMSMLDAAGVLTDIGFEPATAGAAS